MITDTEGIVLRQVKTVNGRAMVTIFSRKFGKISVGTRDAGGKSKSNLAARPFTYSNYELFKGRDSYNLNSGSVIKSHFSIGENLDKFMAASYVLELTEKMLPEELPQPRLFVILEDFMDGLEKREKKLDTLVIAYMVKALGEMGAMPVTHECAVCGSSQIQSLFSVKEGGMICADCASEISKTDEQPLIYNVKFDIINILNYLQKEPFAKFEKIALDDIISDELTGILKEYISYHLDISNLKSEFVKMSTT